MPGPSKRRNPEEQQSESSNLRNKRSRDGDLPSNEGKQKQSKAKSKKSLTNTVKTRSAAKIIKTTGHLVDDEEVLAIKVSGQDTEFNTDGEEDSNENALNQLVGDGESDSSDSLEEGEISVNNNATVDHNNTQKPLVVEDSRSHDCDSIAETIAHVEEEDEDELFKKWERSLNRRGLRLVDAALEDNRSDYQNKQEKQEKQRGKEFEGSSDSMTTIYKPAVQANIDDKNRLSSSSEEGNKYSSGEEEAINDLINQFAGKPRRDDGIDETRDNQQSRTRYVQDGEMPHTSRESYPRSNQERYRDRDDRESERDRMERERRETEKQIQLRANQLVRDAEKAKGRILDVPGKDNFSSNFDKSVIYALLLDDDYKTVASHVDEITVRRIIEGSYVDFARLISKDRIQDDEQPKVLMVNKEGNTYLGVHPDRDRSVINGIDRWDCAFRVYSKIYLQHNPSRASELVEYSHMIHSIATDYMSCTRKAPIPLTD